MNLILKGRGVELNDRLREYATGKLTKVQRFLERIVEVEVEFSRERNPRVKDRDKVEVMLKTPRDVLRAHAAGADHFMAIDLAADRLETQVRKLKQRLNQKSHRNDGTDRLGPEAEADLVGDAEDGPPIVSVPMQLAKPITPEEAVIELEDRGLQFLLFTNTETMGAGLVYRRDDGSYGLIEHRG